MQDKVSSYKKELESDLAAAKNSKDIEILRVKYLGKKGYVQTLLSDLRNVESSEKPKLGQFINSFKEECRVKIEELASKFSSEEASKAIEQEWLDVTLPGRSNFLGKKHPLTQITERVTHILEGMGFVLQTGPEIETKFNNFDALNYPEDHPAKDMQDTYYISPEFMLRSQTSTIQIRSMKKYKPPIRIAAVGTVYRNEDVSARSHVFFHQVEVLYVDKKVSLADLTSAIKHFLSKLFDKKVELRVRPSYFPFVEPGIEVDVSCVICGGKGCKVCKHSGWMEVGGAGMVHPNVLKNCNIDPEEYSGFAWGFGTDRLTMQIYGIDDIRLLFENDSRFLSQF